MNRKRRLKGGKGHSIDSCHRNQADAAFGRSEEGGKYEFNALE